MSTSVIKEFLVSLGYKVDVSGERRFVDGINNATKTVNELGAAIKALAATGAVLGVAAWMGKMASSMEGLYFASQRSNASAKNLQAFGYAAAQMGSSVQDAQSAVQSLYQWMRNTPGAEALIQRNLGVSTRNANGDLRDTTDILQDIGKHLALMDQPHANQYANILGISLPTLMALKEGMGQFTEDYKKMLSEAGLDSDKAAKSSHDFMVSMRGLGAAFQILGMRVASSLVGNNGAGGALDRFRHIVLSHSGQITRVVDKLADFAGKLFIKLIEWIDNVDWDKVSKGIGDVITWLESIDWKGLAKDIKDIIDGFGGWRTAAIALASILGLGVVSNITSMIGGLGRLIPLLGGTASGFTAIASAAGLAAAGIGGYAAGTYIHDKFIAGTSFGDKLGRAEAWLLSKMGVDEATEAMRLDDAGQAAMQNSSPGKRQPINQAKAKEYLKGLEQKYGLPANLLDSVWATESGRGAHLVSSAGAKGPFQFMPSTAAQYGLKDPFDFASSADAAARLYRDLLSRNHGDLSRALAGYNWGQGNLERYGLGSAPAETRGYIEKIQGLMRSPYQMDNTPTAADATSTKKNAPSVSMSTNVYVNGSSDPVATAREVAGKQDDVNQRTLRNVQDLMV